MSRPTWDTARVINVFDYRSFTFYGQTFQIVRLTLINPMLQSRNPNPQAGWFRLVRVRSPLLTQSLLISFPSGTEMFHFPECRFHILCIQMQMIPYERYRVSPFGNLRIKVCVPLPEAYRSLPRPSSPRDAKASIVCPYTLGRKVYPLDNISFTLQFLFPRLCNFQRSNASPTLVKSAKITVALLLRPLSGLNLECKKPLAVPSFA